MESHTICITCSNQQHFVFQKGDFRYYRCHSCGLLSTYPLPDAGTITAHYEKSFQDGNYQLGQRYMREYLRVYRDIVKKVERAMHQYGSHLQGATILDIGCFTGELLELLKERGANVYGLELQQAAVDIANGKLPGRIFLADVFSNNFPQMQFDVIILSGVIEHLVDPKKLLRRAASLIRDGGVLMLQTPNSSSSLSRILGRFWPPCTPVEHIHLFSKKSITLMLHDVGFDDPMITAHWKKLPIEYVYNNLKNFGLEIYRMARPFYALLPSRVRRMTLPFYGGEMIVFARKRNQTHP